MNFIFRFWWGKRRITNLGKYEKACRERKASRRRIKVRKGMKRGREIC